MTAVTNTVGSYRLQATWMVGDQLELGLTGRLQAWHPEAGGKAVTLIFLISRQTHKSIRLIPSPNKELDSARPSGLFLFALDMDHGPAGQILGSSAKGPGVWILLSSRSGTNPG